MFVAPKFCISIVFSFSWQLKWPQEKLKTMQFWGDKQRALWYVRTPYEARKGKGYFQVKGAVVLVEKLELVVQALFDPLGTPCKPQKGEG